MCVTWKRNVLFETAVLFAERWRHLTYSNEPNFINNALLVAKEYFHFKLSNVTKRATVACAQGASRTSVLACSQCASRTEAPSNGLRKYHRRERTNERTNPHSHVDFLNLIIYVIEHGDADVILATIHQIMHRHHIGRCVSIR